MPVCCRRRARNRGGILSTVAGLSNDEDLFLAPTTVVVMIQSQLSAPPPLSC